MSAEAVNMNSPTTDKSNLFITINFLVMPIITYDTKISNSLILNINNHSYNKLLELSGNFKWTLSVLYNSNYNFILYRPSPDEM